MSRHARQRGHQVDERFKLAGGVGDRTDPARLGSTRQSDMDAGFLAVVRGDVVQGDGRNYRPVGMSSYRRVAAMSRPVV